MWHLLMLFVWAPTVRAMICTRHPANTATPKSPVDENYVISISGNPETYILGQEYNVSLNAFNGHRYISFILALEKDNGEFSFMNDLGRFELNDMIETRFSPNCINMVENTNTNPKTHMHLTWTAPSQPGSGCILIRATVLQHRDVWHMDDGGLTRRICEEVVDDVESQPTGQLLNSPCCACDEARYELTFEGVWSRNLHPKNFPARGWEARFCELVGAAHSSDYRFWEAGALASEGVKQYAEHGATRLLEREFSLNFREQKIRTIIKARGPAFPNLNSKSMASVRVDPVHHMVSFASKIDPSPDWVVGVSGLELCLRNCTWLDTKVINLYPWDMGTDAGPTYTSPDQPQVPADVIRRIRSDFPNDPRSPFYDETGAPMKPMAILTIRRQRIYERRCLEEDSNNDVDVPRECLTHPWSSFSDCSTKCGEGMQYRRRVYKQPELARIYNCNVALYEERACEGQACGLSESMRNVPDYDEMGMPHQQQQQPTYQRRAECQLSGWSVWSSCSVTCGEGYQLRQRQYVNPNAELKCQNVHRVELQEMRKCAGRDCLGNLPGSEGISGDMDEPQPEHEADQFDREPNYNRDYEEEPIGDNRRASAFDVGNLKGTQSQRTDAQWPLQRKTPEIGYEMDKSSAENYGQLPRLEDADRAPWQRTRPSDNYKEEQQQRSSGQRQRNDNRDTAIDEDEGAEEQPERVPWQRPNSNNYYRKYAQTNGAEAVEPEQQGEVDPYLSKQCFQMLRTNPRCRNQTIVGHFWFYNFCADECMLFAADPCDRNVNKFNRLEACENCRRPEFQQIQERAATSQECQIILATQRAQQRFQEEERSSSYRRSSYGNRQRG